MIIKRSFLFFSVICAAAILFIILRFIHFKSKQNAFDFSKNSAALRHLQCRENLEKLGALLFNYARENSGLIPGGGPSGLTGLQKIAEKYKYDIPDDLFTCPIAKAAKPARLPNGVLRIMKDNTNYRICSKAHKLGETGESTILLYEARSFDKKGRWVLYTSGEATWINNQLFNDLSHKQNLYGLPPELLKTSSKTN